MTWRRAVAVAASIVLVAACADEFAVDPVDGFTANLSADDWPAELVVGDTVTLRAEVREETSGALVDPHAIDWTVVPAGALQLIAADADSVRFRVAGIGPIQLTASLDDPAFDTASVRATLQGVLFGIDVQPLAGDTLRSFGDTALVQVVATDRHGQPFAATGFAWTLHGSAVTPTGPQTASELRVVAAANGTAWVVASHAQCFSGGVCRDSVLVGVRQTPASVALAADSIRLGALTATTELTASVHDAQGQPIAGATGIAWESSSSAATVVANPTDSTRATVTAVDNGVAIVRVRVGAAQDSLLVRVAQRAVDVVPIAGLGQSGTVGAALTDSLRVEARDSLGRPVAGAAIGWSVSSGSLAAATTTDASGRAAAAWTLGPVAGTQTAYAFLAGVDTTAFAATALAGSAAVVSVSPDSVTLAAIGAADTLAATILDAHGNTTSATLAWTSLTPAVASVDAAGVVTAVANGSAQIEVRAGSARDTATVHVQQVAASVALSVDSLRFASLGATATLTATVRDARGVLITAPAGLQWETTSSSVATIAAGDSDAMHATVTAVGNGSTFARVTLNGITDQATVVVQQVVTSALALGESSRSGTVGQLLADSIRVEARDAGGSPVPGASVVWSVTAGGGSVTGAGTTAANGRAAAAWRLGNVPGTNQVRAIVAGTDTVFFSATANAGAATSLTITPGDTTLTSLGTTIQYSATLRDALANVVGGSVSWSSSASGVASVGATGLVTPLANGTAAIVASSGSLADTVFVTIAQAPATITLSVDSLRFGALGATANVSATVRDASGAVVSAPRGITWESTTSAATVGVPTADSTQAVVTAAANGSGVLRVRIGALSDEATITVQQVVASAAIVAGANQSGVVGTALPDSLRLEALDALGVPVAGAPVVWSVLSGGGSVSGTSTTGANGRAAVRWTLGGSIGTQQVRAVVAGSDTLFFSATASAAPAASLTLTPAAATLNFIGDTTQLGAIVQDAFGNALPAAVTWSSTDAAVATVGGSGIVTAVGSGTASVIAQSGLLADTTTITVQQVVASIDVTPAADTLMGGDTLRLTASARDSLGTTIGGAAIVWSSTDTLVATVDATGKVTARARGVASVRASVGAVTSSATITVAAWALSFDGDDFAEVPNAAAIEGDSIFTVEVWVRPDSTNGGELLAVWGTNRQTSSWALGLNGLVPQLLIQAPTGATVDTLSGGAPLAEDVWQHVAFVYDRGSATLYVNGVATVSDTGLVRPNQDGTPTLRFGANASGPGGAAAGFLSGDLDEIRIWSVARTPAEIAANLSSSVFGQTRLRAYWPLSSGSGDPVDRVGGLIATRGGTVGAAAQPTWIMDGSPAP